MSQNQKSRSQAHEWIDKLAPKVKETQNALKRFPIEDIAWRSGATLLGSQLHVKMLFQSYEIDAATFNVNKSDGDRAASFFASLILTYLQTADGTPSAGRWISFRELPNGAFYHQAFQGYAPDRLTKRWGLNLDAFVNACRKLGGLRLDIGDAGFILPVLPRIDIAVIYWLGDEDFPSRSSVLFDAHAPHYMVTDGLAILGNQLVSKILSADTADND